MVSVNRSAYKSIEIMKNEKVVRLDVGMNVIFTVKAGVLKKGNLIDIKGKDEKTKLVIETQGNEGETHEETWLLIVIDDDSLDIDEEA